MSKKIGVLYRRADNGQLTTKTYATRHPNTTVKETYKKGK